MGVKGSSTARPDSASRVAALVFTPKTLKAD